MRPLRAEAARITPDPGPPGFGSRVPAPVRHPSRVSRWAHLDTLVIGGQSHRGRSEVNGIRRVVLLCLMIGGTMLLAGQVTAAAGPVRFGANLSSSIFPDNAYSGRTCDNVISGGSGTYACTWIEDQTKNSATPQASARAPKDGFINKVRVIGGKAGSFKLFLARYKPATHQGKVVKAGPTVSYATDPCSPDCHVQTISIAPLQVHKGDMLSIKASKTSILSCNSGGDGISLYHPALAVGAAFTTATDTDGCFLLLQAQYQ